jgi:hypothetical protein
MGSHRPFGHLKHKLWPKERSGVKLPIWLPTTKSRESTWFPCVQEMCDIPLERSWQGLQLFFRPHCNRRFAQEVMCPQSCRTPNCCNFGSPTWESRDKRPFRCGPCGEAQSILQGGRWWLPPSSSRGESCVSGLPMARPSTKSAPTMH